MRNRAAHPQLLDAIRRRITSAPTIFGPTIVLVVILLLFAGVFPFSLSSLHDRFGTDDGGRRQLLLLRSEPSAATGAPIDNIWLVRSDGSGLRRVTNEPGGVMEYSVDPSGARIVYVTPDDFPATALWITDLAGTTRSRLSPSTDPAAYASPAWSPAGDAILYIRRDITPLRAVTNASPPTASLSDSAEENDAPKLFAIAPDGRQLSRVYGAGDEVAEAPVWSPDAAHVALREVFAERGQTTLIISDFTANPVKVPIGTSTRTAWSPDSQWLAYDESIAGGDIGSRIILLRADGTGHMSLFPGNTTFDTAPTWSPDGETLAFLRRASGPPPAGTVAAITEVWRATRDGHGLKRLFESDGLASSEPLWSPDGQMLASTRYRVSGTSERDVWIVNADGSRPRRLVKDATRPVWLP